MTNKFYFSQKVSILDEKDPFLTGLVKQSKDDGTYIIKGSDGNTYIKKAESLEEFTDDTELIQKAKSKYGEGKHQAMVMVKNKKGKVFMRKQEVGVEGEEKVEKPTNTQDKPAKEPQWYDEYKQFNLSKYPVGMKEEDVEVNSEGDINSRWVMKWKNPKSGKQEMAYTREFLQRNAENKWKRIQNIDADTIEMIRGKSLAALKDNKLSDKEKDAAAIINIIANTGLRPGDKTHFESSGNRGVSTLSKENIKIVGTKIYFSFVGKSFQQNDSVINSKQLVDYLKPKLAKLQDKDFVFTANRNDAIVTFRLKLGFKTLKLKDMRTYVATDEARRLLFEDETPPPPLPKNKKDIKKLLQKKLNDVFEKVSQKLNNTPAMAKSSYIHPVVIDTFLTKLGVNRELVMKGEEVDIAMSLDEIINLNKERYAKIKPTAISEEDEELVDYFLLPKWWE